MSDEIHQASNFSSPLGLRERVKYLGPILTERVKGTNMLMMSCVVMDLTKRREGWNAWRLEKRIAVDGPPNPRTIDSVSGKEYAVVSVERRRNLRETVAVLIQ